MRFAYYWHRGEMRIIDREKRPLETETDVDVGARGVEISFSEFRDLVQCQARGALIVTSTGGRPKVVLARKLEQFEISGGIEQR